MGRKKQPAWDDGSIASQQGGGNSKKKGFVIGDDEYSIGTGSEELLIQEEKVGANAGKKSKKNSKSVKLKVEEEGDQLDEEEDLPALMISGKKKSKAKKGVGGSVFSSSAFGLLDENGEDDDADVSALTGTSNDDDDDVPAVTFTGNKKSSKVSKKGGSNLFSAAAFEVVDNDGSEVLDSRENGQKSEDDELPVISFTGKKKSSKARKKNVDALVESTVAGLDERGVGKNEKQDEDEEEVLVSFSGKKKKSSKGLKNTGNSFSVALLNEESMEEVSQLANKSGDTSVDEFQCKAEDADAVAFSGMKKTFKKTSKDVSGAVTLDAGIVNEISNPAGTETLSTNTEADELQTNRTEVAESSKSKRKKKKSGRTAQEEDDLDRILAELGEGPPAEPASLHLAQEGKTQVEGPETVATADATVEKEGDNEVVESAAAKKKKKKKEKEKEKKAAAAAEASTAALAPSQAKGDKKVPKHIREMQEALARLREAEERKKIEEEERQRKEEEERRRQEELERQAEEARRRKKEREKEKLLKKKQEGRLLTGKQKEEARRLEAMRNQFLAGAGGLPPSSSETGGVAVKRPIYQTRKSKPATQPNGSAPKGDEKIEAREIPQETEGQLVSSELETEEKMDIANVEENSEVADMVAENGVEEDTEDEWDAKSWDDADVILPNRGAFADEESSFEPEPTIRRKDTSAVTASRGTTPLMGAPKPAVSAKRAPFSPPTKSREVEKKNSQPDIGVEDTSRGEASLKNEAPRSGDVPERSKENLRSPICCIMGHVDTGKTKLLDCIRGTNVQGGEAGGITQQIGATYFPAENIREKTKGSKAAENLKVPGLLIIDTPGHESFTNLRSRGSGLCDIAILVVDIMHGLEPQTVESLNLLRMRNTEFIVALNKVDRLYGWKTCRNAPIKKAIEQQSKDVQNEFNERLTEIVTKFKEQGLNTELYYKNRKMRETYSIVPTSAISGEGIPDLLLLLCKWTEETMVEKLTFSEEVQCTVLEVKVIEGHGTTIDVVLVNGTLHEGDQIVVCGMQGVIVTNIRALLTPHPMKELRVKGTYLHHKEIKAAQGIKITAQGLEHAVAGTCLYVVGPDDDLEDVKEAAREDMKSVMNRIDKSDEGVYVQASTLGSLEALLEFLKSSEVKIPVSGIGIGPVHKNDVMKASVMLEKKKEYATILAFDVKVTPEARELSKEYGVKIFMADIIYHLFDQFKAYIKTVREERKREAADEAVFPCVLKIIPNCIFNKKDPIVLGVDVLEGIVKVGTPMCVPQQDFIDIGRIASIENNHKPVDTAKRGQKVAIKIVGANPDEQQKMFGRHFEVDDELVSHISRTSIDVLKANYKDDLSLDDWRLVLRLKKLFNIT